MFRNQVESPKTNGIPREEVSNSKSLFDWIRLLCCLLVVALGLWILSTETKTFDVRRNWTDVGTVFVFAFLGLKPWLDRRDGEEKNNVVRLIYWALAIPMFLATLVFQAQYLVTAYHWLGPGLSIAAVLIVVVLGILFKD